MAEYNLIQSPELIRRLTSLLGLRQAHIAPTLDENVSAVVVISDVSREPEYLPRRFSAAGAIDGDNAVVGGGFQLQNPLNSGVIAKVTRVITTQFSVVRQGGDSLYMSVEPFGTNALPNVINTVRGRDWRKGKGTVGQPAGEAPSTLFLLTGTGNTNLALTQFNVGVRGFQTGNTATDTVGIVELDTTDWGIFLQPGFQLSGMLQDPIPAGTCTVMWEERPQAAGLGA